MDPDSFNEFVARLVAGDPAAREDLANQYQRHILRWCHGRLRESPARRLADAADIWQSVYLRFLLAVEGGKVQLTTYEGLRNLLIRMAHNRIGEHERRRRSSRVCPGDEQLLSAPSADNEPPTILEEKEEVERAKQVRAKLEVEDRYLLDQRMEGRGWEQLAFELHQEADTLRKRLTRAISRVLRREGLRSAEA